MPHPNRVWFIGEVNDRTNQFLLDNHVPGFDPDVDYLIDVKVRIHGLGIVSRNLIRLKDYSSIAILERHQKEHSLRFVIFVQDTRDSLVVPWVGQKNSARKKVVRSSR